MAARRFGRQASDVSARRLRPALMLDAILLACFAVALLVLAYPTLAHGTWWGYDARAYWSVD